MQIEDPYIKEGRRSEVLNILPSDCYHYGMVLFQLPVEKYEKK